MIASMHIADVGPRDAIPLLLRPPRPTRVPGLTYAETLTTAPLGEPLLPPRGLRQVGLLAAWEDDAALDAFLADDPVAARLAGGWHLRLEPLRVFGAWAGMPDLPARELPVDDGEPVAIVTLGQLRLRRIGPFRRSAAPAEAAASASPGLIAGTGLARPPRLVATFSLWRSAAEMRAYAYGDGEAHVAAMAAHRAKSFHHESAFVRFRPYAARGSWGGREPLAEVTAAPAT